MMEFIVIFDYESLHSFDGLLWIALQVVLEITDYHRFAN